MLVCGALVEMLKCAQMGAALLVRFHPCRVVLGDATGAPLALGAVLQRQRMATLRPWGVPLGATGGQHAGRGWVPASRLHVEPAHRARPTCRQGHTKGPPSAASLFVAGGVLGLTTLAPLGRSAQTIRALDRGRWHVESAIQRWKRVRDVDALRAKASSPLAAVWLPGTWL